MSRPRVGLLALGVVVILGLLAAWVLVIPRQLAPNVPDEVLGRLGERARLEATDARVKLRNDLRTTPLQAIAWLAALLAAVVGFQQLSGDRQQATETQELTRQGQASERFTRAIGQLGSERREVQLSGIYGLEQIAREAPDNRLAVTDVLIGYLNRRIPQPAKQPPEYPLVEELRIRAPEAQAALTVLGRRQTTPTDPALDLRGLDLRSADLRGANLSFANLYDADLRHAKLSDPNLRDADPRGADLRHADLGDSTLDGADLRAADLRGANLGGADLDAIFEDADLREANLTEAHLQGADLRGADLRGVKVRIADFRDTILFGTDLRGVHFYDANLYGAVCDEATKWPDGFDWQDAGVTRE